jgi:D-threo-aldose 1-dehydrogenase
MGTPGLTVRKLGRTAMEVTPLGLGGGYLGTVHENGTARYDEATGIATVLHALELGIRLIDTSAGYLGDSRSERMIGAALAQWIAGGGRREELVISTKTGTRNTRLPVEERYSAEATQQSVRTSMELLGTGYLDAVLVHDPPDMDPVLAPGGAWEALKEMKAQGLVRAIGLGVRHHAFHRRLMATGECDLCLTYRDYNLLDQSAVEGVLKPAATDNLGIFNGTSLYHGLLAGEDPLAVAERMAPHSSRHPAWHAELTAAAQRAHALWTWCQDWDVSLMALNLQFCTRPWNGATGARVHATLMGASNPEQIAADVAAMAVEIPEQMWAELPERLAQATV